MLRSVLIALCAIATVAPAAAQQTFQEKIDITIVNIDAIVTDRAGKPVTGLTKSDFEIFENRKRQTISNFSEIVTHTDRLQPADIKASEAEPAPKAAAPKPRRFIVFIDNYSIDPARRLRVFAALEDLIERELLGGDRVALFTWNRTLKLALPFTAEREQFSAALREEEHHVAGLAARDVEQVKRDCAAMPENCLTRIRAFAEEELHNEQNLIESMKTAMASVAGFDGRKIFVLAGSRLPEYPGKELFDWYMRSGNLSLEGIERSQKAALEKLARDANASGITFYPIDTDDMNDGFGAAFSEAPDSKEAFTAFTNTAAAYRTLADMTGGSALTNTTNYGLAMQTISSDLSSYYSLGYRTTAKGGEDRAIVVKAVNPAYTVRTRRRFGVKSDDDQMRDRVLANIYTSFGSGSWAFEVKLGTPVRKRSHFELPIELAISPEITLVREGENLTGGFTVYTAVADSSGRFSAVGKSVQPVRIPADAEASLRERPMIFTAVLEVRPGDGTLSIAVVDQLSSNAGFERLPISAK